MQSSINIEALTRIFVELDTNQDKRVSRTDLEQCLVDLGLSRNTLNVSCLVLMIPMLPVRIVISQNFSPVTTRSIVR